MQGTSLQTFNKFGRVVKEEKLFKEIVDARMHGPSQKPMSSGELKINEPKNVDDTHCQLDMALIIPSKF
jgi:hypothetical protein